jgi:hypothetical protein
VPPSSLGASRSSTERGIRLTQGRRTITEVTGPEFADELYEEWDDLTEEDFEPLPAPPWRRPLLIVVASLTALAMAAVPLYNVLFAQPVSESGLEICGFDYCIVQEAVQEAGVDLTMSRLANTFLDEEGARQFARRLTDYLGIPPVGLQVVDRLDGRIGGVYDPEIRLISIERPARAWIVLHEVAHAVEQGHGDDFQQLVIELARWVSETDG